MLRPTEKMPLYKVIKSTGEFISQEVEDIKNSKRIKTEKSKKSALIELWNSALDRAIESRNEEKLYDKAILKAYYGMVNALTFRTIELNECYDIIEKIACDMQATKKGDWNE